VSRFVSEPETWPRPTQCKIWQKVLMSICFIYFIAHYIMEVHTLEPTLFCLFTISLHVLPKTTIHTSNSFNSGLTHCNVLIKFNCDMYKPTANFTVHEILVNIFTCTKLSK